MKHIKIFEDFINENSSSQIYYHGSTDKKLEGKNGIHIGTKLAATQALEARIGVPATGEWNGKTEYGKTLLAGKITLRALEKQGKWCMTGYNAGSDVPEEDYYPTQREEVATYSDGTKVSMKSKPIIFPVRIVGPMTNTPNKPHGDMRANSMMTRAIKSGNAKSGFYYTNIAEDEGSISAVVPDKTFLEII